MIKRRKYLTVTEFVLMQQYLPIWKHVSLFENTVPMFVFPDWLRQEVVVECYPDMQQMPLLWVAYQKNVYTFYTYLNTFEHLFSFIIFTQDGS